MTYKSLSQRDLNELLEIFREFGLDLPSETPTKQELKVALKQHGITNNDIKNWESKKDYEPNEKAYENMAVDQVTGDVIVAMDRKNAWFEYKQYKFSSERKFVPMSAEDAETLLASWTGFHKATKEEIRSYYK